MAWAQTQGNKATSNSATPACAFTSSPAVGATLVYVVCVNGNVTFSSMHDTIGNGWTSLGIYNDATRGATTQAWAAVNTTNSADTCTVTSSVSDTWDAMVFEFSGGPASVTQSGAVTGVNVTAASPVVTPSFTAALNDLLISSATASGTASFNAPWAAGQVTTNGNGASYLLNASAGAHTANWSDSSTVSNDVSAIWALSIGAAAVVIPDLIAAPMHR